MGSFIMSPILQIFGRKACHCSLNAFFLTGWIIFPFAHNIAGLYAARFIQGISAGGIYINNFIISEYVHPCRRGYFITLKKATITLGVLCCHAMSAFWTWRQIAAFAGVFNFISLILTFFWPESPSHLALKNQFAECEKSFKWLNGNSAESQKQLKTFVETQREKMFTNKKQNNNLVELAKKFLKKDFQKAFLITLVLTLSINVCGRYYYTAYIIQIMTELMNDKTSALYFSLGADLLTLIAVSASTVVITLSKRRTILLSSGIISVFLMFLISILVFLKSIYSFPTPVLWFTALIIILQSFTVNIGVVPVAFAIIGEIFPLEHKGFGSFTSCFVFTTLYATILKLTPVLMEYTKLYGTYGIFGIVLAVCMMILYRIVPETKDKTLQEIEDELNNLPSKEMTVMEREKSMN